VAAAAAERINVSGSSAWRRVSAAAEDMRVLPAGFSLIMLSFGDGCYGEDFLDYLVFADFLNELSPELEPVP